MNDLIRKDIVKGRKVWVDDNNNSWPVVEEKLSSRSYVADKGKERALNSSLTLSGCTNCYCCTNCTDCNNCISCNSCHNCDSCSYCNACYDSSCCDFEAMINFEAYNSDFGSYNVNCNED